MDSVKNALRVLEAIGQAGSIGVSQLARDLNEPKTTVQRSLTTLAEAGWIKPTASAIGQRRVWSLSARMLVVASQAGIEAKVRRIAYPIMDRLRAETLETIHLMVRDGREAVLIEKLESSQPLRTVRQIGERAPLHSTSNGKAILAAGAPEILEQYLARPLEPYTRNTITDPAKLRRELLAVRKEGYAVSRSEANEGIRAVAAAILVKGSPEPAAAISISCPSVRLTDEVVPKYGQLVRRAAAQIGRDLSVWRRE